MCVLTYRGRVLISLIQVQVSYLPIHHQMAYLDSIGGSATNGIFTENGTYGPSGNFYLFNWTNANALCTTYNTLSLGGRTNWRLATRDELKGELYDIFGNMFTARGWPTRNLYWSATPDGSYY